MKNESGWFVNSFCTDAPSISSSAPPPVRKRPNQTAVQSAAKKRPSEEVLDVGRTDCINFLDRFTPRSTDELAVHPKKVEEVRDWLSNNASGGILLLIGPNGTGKSATLRVLCEEKDIAIEEWTYSDEIDVSDDGALREVPEFESFSKFLMNRDRSCGTRRKRRIALVEFLPNECYETPSRLHNLLRDRSKMSSPVVVCLSTVASCWHLCPRRLLPDSFCFQLPIHSITFNPVANTYLLKALKRAANQLTLKVVDSDLKLLMQNAEGDIRKALSSLQLAMPLESRKKGVNRDLLHLPDTLLTLFHLLGRLLYAKRLETSSMAWQKAERRLAVEAMRRPEPERDVNLVIAEPPKPAAEILLYLSEHEPRFVGGIAELRKTLDALSLADFAFDVYNHRQTFDEYALQVGSRSIMYNNYSTEKRGSNGKYQFTKPAWRDLNNEVDRMKRQTDESLSTLRKGDYYTLTVPLATRIHGGSELEEYLGRRLNGGGSWQQGWEAWKREGEGRLRQERKPVQEESDEEYTIEESSDSDF